MPRASEASIERAAVKAVENLYSHGRGRPSIVRKVNGFGFSHWPDRMILIGGDVFFIEFKRPGASLNPGQKKFFPLLRSLGYAVYVCRSVEEALRACEEFARYRGQRRLFE